MANVDAVTTDETTTADEPETVEAPTAGDASVNGDGHIRFWARLRALPSLGSWAGALILWWPSLRPTLLPRSALIQGAISAICIAVGYALGGFIGRLIHLGLRRAGRAVSHRVHRGLVIGLWVITAIAVVVGSYQWYGWQRDQRPLVGMDGISATTILPMLVVTVIVSLILIEISRIIRHGIAWTDRQLARSMSQRSARWSVAAIVTVIAVLAFNWAFAKFGDWADTNFSAFDDTTREGVEPPTESTASGGPGSLVQWDDLGFEGRNFVAGAPTVADLEGFDPSVDAMDPIRVYVGLQSADTVEERVDLAVQELERTGAFDREVLVAFVPTGTGWVDPDAARTIEYMYGGDTAIAAVQYSYLPSWIAFLLDTQSPRELGTALYDGIYDAWSKLPADDRPTLLAFGQSLGSMGGEAAFDEPTLAESVASITSRYDGALFTGPTRSNAIFGRLIDERDPGTPAWKPAVAALPNVRVVNKISEIDPADTTWEYPRLLWVHHPSDAIGTWQPSNIWSSPGWADDPPPYDVPAAATWVPFVTWVQESFDLMAGFSATPGFGHDYRTDFVHSWAAIAPPDGWTQADSDALRTYLDLDGGPS